MNVKKSERKISEDASTIMEDFGTVCKQFTYKRNLGSGKYGRVFLTECSETGQQVAVKAIPRVNSIVAKSMAEVETLAEVDHPNIVRYLKHYHSEKYLYVVMEYCEGKELFDELFERGNFTEAETALIMEKILRAVNHCHQLNIIHCDLKPENIIYSSEAVLKIIDFGLSIKLRNISYEGIAGTAYYIAPEIIKSGLYTKACDIWSLGIIMHAMLTGFVPINGGDFAEIAENLKNFQGVNFNLKMWQGISPEAKDLVKKMLNPEPTARITAEEALNHPWFASREPASPSRMVTVLEALRRYSEFPEVKRDLLEVIVKTASDGELKEYQELFLEVDKEKTGLITGRNLEIAFNTEKNLTIRKELEELVKKVSHKGNGFINYTEFLAALIATNKFLTEERLSIVFKMLEQESINVAQRKALTSDAIQR